MARLQRDQQAPERQDVPLGFLGVDRLAFERRAHEWERHALDAEARLEAWLVRGEGPETAGAIMRARQWAVLIRTTAESYRIRAGPKTVRGVGDSRTSDPARSARINVLLKRGPSSKLEQSDHWSAPPHATLTQQMARH